MSDASSSAVTELAGSMRRYSLLVVVVVYLVLGVVYSAMSPVFEAPDERQHYGYVRHLALQRRLPPQTDHSWAEHEAAQPPLYYMVAGLATAWRPHDPPLVLQPNRFYASYQAPGTVHDNKNVQLHSDIESFPWRGSVLTVRLTRMVNLFFGVLTIVATYLLGRATFRGQQMIALGGAAAVALTPQFLFISSAINNDIAVTAFCTIALWLLARGLRRGYSAVATALLGVTIGLAALSKISGLGLLPLALLAVGLSTWAQARELPPARRRALVAARCSLLLTVALMVGGWWYVRSALLYQDPLGVHTHLGTPWRYEQPLPLRDLWAQLPGVAISFWAAFGMGNVNLPTVAYLFIGSAWVLAAVGLAAWAVQSWLSEKQPGPQAWSLAVLAVWVLLVCVALLRWMQLVKAALGRLLFPALAALSILTVWGLVQLVSHGLGLVGRNSDVRPGVSRAVIATFCGFLLVAAGIAPFVSIRPAYARPALLSRQEIAARIQPFELRFGESIRLVGYGVDRATVHPGEDVSVTLCWESIGPMDADYAYFVHLLGRDNTIVGARNTFAGLGRFTTSQWTPGDAFCDVVRVPLREDVPVQAVYDVEIGWYDPDGGGRLPPRGTDGSPLSLVLLDRIRVVPVVSSTTTPPQRVNAHLEGRVELVGYALSETPAADSRLMTVTLYWKALAPLEDDYTVFVHLAPPGAPPTAQSDSQPRGGSYPTSYWDAGEVVVDEHVLQIPEDIPPGEYQLLTGMYLLETGDRLARLMPDGTSPSAYVHLETLVFEGGYRSSPLKEGRTPIVTRLSSVGPRLVDLHRRAIGCPLCWTCCCGLRYDSSRCSRSSTEAPTARDFSR